MNLRKNFLRHSARSTWKGTKNDLCPYPFSMFPSVTPFHSLLTMVMFPSVMLIYASAKHHPPLARQKESSARRLTQSEERHLPRARVRYTRCVLASYEDSQRSVRPWLDLFCGLTTLFWKGEREREGKGPCSSLCTQTLSFCHAWR